MKYISMRSSSSYARLKLMAYYLQRLTTSRRLRHVATLTTIACLRALRGRAASSGGSSESVVALRETGYLPLGRLLSEQQCDEILAHMRSKRIKATRGSGESFTVDAVPPGTSTGDHELEHVVNCPHIMELANHPALLALAASYIGYTPTITLLGMRWSFPDDRPDVDVQGFHRDSEAGSVKLMVYLTEVDMDAGPHHYVPGTHRDRMPLRMQRYADADIARLHGAGIVVTGAAGTAFLIDTKGIHKGMPPAGRARLLLGIQYSLLPCLVYEYEPVAYRGAAAVDPYVNRLMVAAAPLIDEAYDEDCTTAQV